VSGSKLGVLGAAAEARRAEAAEQLQATRLLITSTERVAGLTGQLINNILEVATYVIPAEGYVTREYGAAAGYVTLSPGQATRGYTIEAAPARSGAAPVSAPTSGVGVFVTLPSTLPRTVPLASRVFTVYGTPGDSFSMVAGTAAPTPVLG
jgi:hypothetical protein